MKSSLAVIKVGTRSSKLALIQTHGVLERWKSLFPGVSFEENAISTLGDRDKKTDLKISPPDFFTRDLDDAVRSGKIDCAIHSAKDLPNPVPEGLDWFWLPWREDPSDAIVLAPGGNVANLPAAPRIGVSSERREAWCLKRFPHARLIPIRGTIEDRLSQLDKGEYDVVIMASAALIRLGLEERITERIADEEMQVPDGQGALAVTFRSGDKRFLRMRSLFVKTVTFVGAGVGSYELCTVGGLRALKRCEVCLYDSLMDQALLEYLPRTAVRIDTGKRCGDHSMPQDEISKLITHYSRRGMMVVRLKGGDPGVFGRLAEEVEALDVLHLPYRVLAGVSSLNVATTQTGMLLTRRGVSRGFTVMTPRKQGGGIGSIQKEERAGLPIAFFMGMSVVKDIVGQLKEEGMSGSVPAALVFNAGSEYELIIRGNLDDIASRAGAKAQIVKDQPGLLVVGEAAKYGYDRSFGALSGQRVLLTCSADLQEKAADCVNDLGGVPIKRPLIRLVPEAGACELVKNIDRYDWLVLTSPAAVRCFFELFDSLCEEKMALIRIGALPRIIVCGPGSAAEVRKYRVQPAAEPASDFGAGGLKDMAHTIIKPGQKVLRLRSDKAGGALAEFLRSTGAKVDDFVLYRNETVKYVDLPEFEAVFFASASAVDVFVAQWGASALNGKKIAVIGKPTMEGLAKHGVTPQVIGREATVASCIETLAENCVVEALEKTL